MTPGVSLASVSSLATFSMITGTADANYGVANLADTVNNAKVARFTHAGGIVAFSFNLSAASLIQFAALVRHNLVGAETVRVRLYSGASLGGSLLADSGVISVWPSGAAVSGYGQTRPYVHTAAVTALSGRVDFAGISSTLEIGALELAQWWAITGVSPGAEIGIDTRAQDVALVGGGAEAADVFTPRIMNGQCDLMALATAATTGIDFQASLGKTKPFVWVQDYDDPTTWGRGCWPARNADLPPLVGALYRHDRFQMRFLEHLR